MEASRWCYLGWYRQLQIELTWLKDHPPSPYELGENEKSYPFATDLKQHTDMHEGVMSCICWEQRWGYFYSWSDDYWLEDLFGIGTWLYSNICILQVFLYLIIDEFPVVSVNPLNRAARWPRSFSDTDRRYLFPFIFQRYPLKEKFIKTIKF